MAQMKISGNIIYYSLIVCFQIVPRDGKISLVLGNINSQYFICSPSLLDFIIDGGHLNNKLRMNTQDKRKTSIKKFSGNQAVIGKVMNEVSTIL